VLHTRASRLSVVAEPVCCFGDAVRIAYHVGHMVPYTAQHNPQHTCCRRAPRGQVWAGLFRGGAHARLPMLRWHGVAKACRSEGSLRYAGVVAKFRAERKSERLGQLVGSVMAKALQVARRNVRASPGQVLLTLYIRRFCAKVRRFSQRATTTILVTKLGRSVGDLWAIFAASEPHRASNKLAGGCAGGSNEKYEKASLSLPLLRCPGPEGLGCCAGLVGLPPLNSGGQAGHARGDRAHPVALAVVDRSRRYERSGFSVVKSRLHWQAWFSLGTLFAVPRIHRAAVGRPAEKAGGQVGEASTDVAQG
jgi:hypothetical protein